MEQPPRKRRIIAGSSDRADCYDQIGRFNRSVSNSCESLSSIESASPESSASSAPSPRSACDFLHEIENFIPVGCIRLERYKCQITAEVWTSCDEWHWIGHPREIIIPGAGPFLQNVLQEVLFNVSPLAPYRSLHQAGWIRLEFKMRDAEWGQIRVYILPEDVDYRMMERNEHSLKRSLQRLMTEIDTNKQTWDAQWSPDTPVIHIDTDLNGDNDNEVSLFYLFNSLPSPIPDSSVLQDLYARDAMNKILDGNLKGLKTKMLAYQRRSAAMMLQKESQPSQLVDPRLRKVVDQFGLTWYCDITNGTCLRTPRMYEAARGGICAETMGLGKTLICLALILATRDLSSEIPVEYSVGTIPVRKRVGSLLDMSAAAIGRTATPWKEYFKELEADGSDYARCREAIRKGAGHYYIPAPIPVRVSRNPVTLPPRRIYLSTATLVVVPANLVRQWEREIEKHTTGLKVLVMRSNQVDLPPAAELAEYDIILFSRQRFERESKDGTDNEGRRQGSGAASPKCTGFYHSPLRDLHFKRLITDEGHTMGNARTTSKTNAVIVVDFLQLTSRWIVSGTPTQGLYGVDNTSVFHVDDIAEAADDVSTPLSSTSINNKMLAVGDVEQERKDLEKLGNIATTYLKARPWANARYDRDFASWPMYVMQPRHGSRSHGNLDCLRNILEGMIIRHRPADVEKDVELPPLRQKIVYIEGSLQDKISLNLFSLAITSNAVTSERKDADYLFHPRQRKALGQLVANLRQASFFWCGFTTTDVKNTIKLAKSFLEKGEIYASEGDRYLLQKVIECGEAALSNSIWRAASEHHEMPFYIQNDWPSTIRAAWSLDAKNEEPTLFGSTQILTMQKFIYQRLEKNQKIDGLEDAGRAARAAALASSVTTPVSRSKTSKLQKKLDDTIPPLAGGLRIAEDLSPKKKRIQSVSTPTKNSGGNSKVRASPKKLVLASTTPVRNRPVTKQGFQHNTLPYMMEAPMHSSTSNTALPSNTEVQPPLSTLNISIAPEMSSTSSTILSTASSKLSYLITQILLYQESEKIIVFYETDNVAYYIAQALEAINVEHLIYARSLSSDRRSTYIVTFNQQPRFRVLLMDISQAAFGLDVSAASRVYFVNPVFNKQVEAQAVKRAHRIGQFRPVYVETLVLRGSIEEVIIERRKMMSSDEQKKCKTVLDDETMYDWIKNVRFVPLPKEEILGPAQMAPLETAQPVFNRKKLTDSDMNDPDADLVLDFTSSPEKRRKDRAKILQDAIRARQAEDSDDEDMIVYQAPSKKRGRSASIPNDFEKTSSSSRIISTQPRNEHGQLLRQLNTTPYPYGPAASSPSPPPLPLPLSMRESDRGSVTAGAGAGAGAGTASSREGSPSKAERSRLNTEAAREMLARSRPPRLSSSPDPGTGTGTGVTGGTGGTGGIGGGGGVFASGSGSRSGS